MDGREAGAGGSGGTWAGRGSGGRSGFVAHGGVVHDAVSGSAGGGRSRRRRGGEIETGEGAVAGSAEERDWIWIAEVHGRRARGERMGSSGGELQLSGAVRSGAARQRQTFCSEHRV